MAERNYYMVRAMSSSEDDFKVFFDNGVVAVGWSNVNFKKYTNSQDLREAVKEAYYKNNDIAPQALSKKLNQVERFSNIKEGDYIIVPCWSDIAIAVAGKDHIYSDKKFDYDCDLANQIKVEYVLGKDGNILKIPRYKLTEGLQRRLRVRGNTVANLYDFKDEIDEIFAQGEEFSYENQIKKIRDEEIAKFKTNLLKNIQNGDTNLKAGGIGLENLVKELLECNGYCDVTILPKSTYEVGVDADIEAIREDDFVDEEYYYIQVKHHRGVSGKEGIVQLINVREKEEKYKEYKWIFITSADSISKEAQDLAFDNDIIVKDGKELADMIVKNLDKLKEETKQALGICEVPFLASSKR